MDIGVEIPKILPIIDGSSLLGGGKEEKELGAPNTDVLDDTRVLGD